MEQRIQTVFPLTPCVKKGAPTGIWNRDVFFCHPGDLHKNKSHTNTRGFFHLGASPQMDDAPFLPPGHFDIYTRRNNHSFASLFEGKGDEIDEIIVVLEFDHPVILGDLQFALQFYKFRGYVYFHPMKNLRFPSPHHTPAYQIVHDAWLLGSAEFRKLHAWLVSHSFGVGRVKSYGTNLIVIPYTNFIETPDPFDSLPDATEGQMLQLYRNF